MTRWKPTAWCLLAAGAGGVVLYLFICLAFLEGRRFAVFGIGSAITTALAALWLWALYRKSPSERSGAWSFGLLDLIAVAVAIATGQALFHFLVPEEFLTVGLPCTLLGGLTLVGGMLLASRKGITEAAPRLVYASGFLCFAFGALVLGGLLTITTFMTVNGKTSPLRIAEAVVTFEGTSSGERPLFWCFRIAPISLALGWWLMRCARPAALAESSLPKTESATPEGPRAKA